MLPEVLKHHCEPNLSYALLDSGVIRFNDANGVTSLRSDVGTDDASGADWAFVQPPLANAASGEFGRAASTEGSSVVAGLGTFLIHETARPCERRLQAPPNANRGFDSI